MPCLHFPHTQNDTQTKKNHKTSASTPPAQQKKPKKPSPNTTAQNAKKAPSFYEHQSTEASPPATGFQNADA